MASWLPSSTTMTSWRGDNRAATASDFSTAARMFATSLRAGSTIEIPSTSGSPPPGVVLGTNPVYERDFQRQILNVYRDSPPQITRTAGDWAWPWCRHGLDTIGPYRLPP